MPRKTYLPFPDTFQTRLTLTLIFLMLLAGAISNFLVYRFSLNTQFENIRTRLKVIATTAALGVDAGSLQKIPLNPEGVNSPEFHAVLNQLYNIKQRNPSILYVYILVKTEKEGIWKFVVDSGYVENPRQPESWPGTEYDASRFPEMLKGYDGPSADTKFETDEWGVTLSGYAPILDSAGNAVAVLGVDMAADDVAALQRRVHNRSLVVLGLAVALSVALGWGISRNIASPLKQLQKATHRIASGVHFQVSAKGPQELCDLADAFNKMSTELYTSRQNLFDYFYRVVQSMVRVLEAKDHHTRGHSERVADYAYKIALQMGITEIKAELIREIAMLHDIGKLAIPDGVLHKAEKLTEEEWEQIKRHPAVGEEILKPLLVSPEMMSIIRGHHERVDGSGYPDGLKGEEINIYAAIVCVADAYDAMTSMRPYRSRLSHDQACAELVKHKGSQFKPEVVEAFLKVIDSEKKG